MKILITGTTGFIGRKIMSMLRDLSLQMEVEVLTLNRNVEKAYQMYPLSDYPYVNHTYVNDWSQVHLFDPELVIHLAALSTSNNDTEVIEPLISTNITYGVFLLNALSRCQSLKLFVNTGSFSEYRLGTSERNSAYLYAATKTAFRSFLDYYSDLYGFKYITAIPYSVYGGQPTIKRLVDYILESIDVFEPIDMTLGEQVLDFIHVNDVASFFIHVIQNIDKYQRVQNREEFHLGTGRGISIRELTSVIESVTGKHCNINWGGRPYRERDTMYAVAPIAKNLELTGWHANIDIKRGILNYIKNTINNE